MLLPLEGLTIRWAHLFEKNICALFKNKNVLDLGCSDGFATNKFIEKGAKSIIGIDTDDECLNVGSLKYKDVVFVKKNVEEIDIEKEYPNADVIVCYGLLYLLKDPVLFINNLSKISNNKTIMIETVVNDYYENTMYTKFDQRYCQFINTNLLKHIFLEQGWKIKTEKVFTVKQINKRWADHLYFGKRIFLVFEK